MLYISPSCNVFKSARSMLLSCSHVTSISYKICLCSFTGKPHHNNVNSITFFICHTAYSIYIHILMLANLRILSQLDYQVIKRDGIIGRLHVTKHVCNLIGESKRVLFLDVKEADRSIFHSPLEWHAWQW